MCSNTMAQSQSTADTCVCVYNVELHLQHRTANGQPVHCSRLTGACVIHMTAHLEQCTYCQRVCLRVLFHHNGHLRMCLCLQGVQSPAGRTAMQGALGPSQAASQGASLTVRRRLSKCASVCTVPVVCRGNINVCVSQVCEVCCRAGPTLSELASWPTCGGGRPPSAPAPLPGTARYTAGSCILQRYPMETQDTIPMPGIR
jgi:hypothetical protein